MVFNILTQKVRSESLSMFLGVILIFMLVNFNKDLGLIYSLMLFLDWMMTKESKGVFFPIEKDLRRAGDMIQGFVAYVAFIVLSAMLLSIIKGSTALIAPLNSVFDVFQSTTPLLSDSKILSFIGWGILIPIIETRFFFGRLLEAFANQVGNRLSFMSIRTWIVIFIVSSIFAMFHLSARAITSTQFDSVAMAMTFLFGVISCVLVIYTKEIASATYLHISSNSVAVSIKQGFRFVGSFLGLPTGG